MKFIVLGCWGAYPEAGEATSGYLLDTGKHKVLLDCGSGVLANLFKYIRVEDLDAVFISHFHYDHIADLGCLIYASKIAMHLGTRNVPLKIYANNKSPLFSELTHNNNTMGIEINPEVIVDLNGLKISFRHTVHDEYNLAMKFKYENKTVVYTGDMGPTTNLTKFCNQADLLVCEASLYKHEEGLFTGHMTSKQTAELAQNANAKKLLLTHFPHIGKIDDLLTEASKYYRGPIALAKLNEWYEI